MLPICQTHLTLRQGPRPGGQSPSSIGFRHLTIPVHSAVGWEVSILDHLLEKKQTVACIWYSCVLMPQCVSFCSIMPVAACTIDLYRYQIKVSDPSCVRLLSSVAKEVTGVVSAVVLARFLASVQIDTHTCVVVRAGITRYIGKVCNRLHPLAQLYFHVCMFPQ